MNAYTTFYFIFYILLIITCIFNIGYKTLNITNNSIKIVKLYSIKSYKNRVQKELNVWNKELEITQIQPQDIKVDCVFWKPRIFRITGPLSGTVNYTMFRMLSQ